MHPTIPPRLHVLFARDRAEALILRRGPSHRACTIGWDRATDRFRVGQWLNGRIYPLIPTALNFDSSKIKDSLAIAAAAPLGAEYQRTFRG